MEIKIHPHVSLVVGHKNFFFNKSKAHFETVFFFSCFWLQGRKCNNSIQYISLSLNFIDTNFPPLYFLDAYREEPDVHCAERWNWFPPECPV